MPHEAVCIISSPFVNSYCSYSPETLKLFFDLCDLDLWPLTLTFCMDITSANGNSPWKFHDDMMMGTWWKRRDGRTDGRTDWAIYRAAWSQLKHGWHRPQSRRYKSIKTLYISINRGNGPEQRISNSKAYQNTIHHLLGSWTKIYSQNINQIWKKNGRSFKWSLITENTVLHALNLNIMDLSLNMKQEWSGTA